MSTASFVNLRDGKTVLQFADRNRLFDPTRVPRYINDLGQPYLLLKYDPLLQVNHMHVGLEYGGKHVHDGFRCADQDTVVMVIGARAMNGYTAGARWFGEGSRYNMQSFPSPELETSLVDQILSTTCAGCNALRDLFTNNPHIKKAYIMTSSEAMIKGVAKLFDWTKNGFPTTLPENMSQMLLGLLRVHLQEFDTRGLAVKFWKVAPEFITGPSFQAECALLDFFEIPPTKDAGTCRCPDCIDLKQYRELKFAKFGMACCACGFGLELAKKYGELKKGDKFVITNNAGVTKPTVTMRVDGKGMVFQDTFSSSFPLY